MGTVFENHQHHFLSRLDRLSLPHVELALSLYRNPRLVRYLLGQMKLPEGADRVAISLDDATRGPFLVVTREGVFVTCLGTDMSPNDLPVVRRAQLDAQLSHVDEYRARLRAFEDIAGEIGGGVALTRRLFQAGEHLSREEMGALAALQPLYEYRFFKLLVEAVEMLDAAREHLLPLLRKTPKPRPEHKQTLRAYWDTVWLAGHLSVIAGLAGPKLLEGAPPEVHTFVRTFALSWGAVRQGMIAVALRGVWLAARVGKDLVASYKQQLPKCASVLTATNATLCLGAIALRHKGLRAEIMKALESASKLPPSGPGPGALPQAAADSVLTILRQDEEDPAELEAMAFRLGSALAVKLGRDLPPDSPFKFRRAEDVPRDLGLDLAMNATNSFLSQPEMVVALYVALPRVARSSAEGLYLPRAYVRAARAPWTPEATLSLLRPLAEAYKERPVTPEGPTRNSPCPCGSGKKHKRCCGRDP